MDWDERRRRAEVRWPGVSEHPTRQIYLENIVEAILRDSRGRLWFGTRAGLIAYQPGDTPPGIVIRQVVAGRLLEMPQAVSCPDSTPEIQFHFQGLSFRQRGRADALQSPARRPRPGGRVECVCVFQQSIVPPRTGRPVPL